MKINHKHEIALIAFKFPTVPFPMVKSIPQKTLVRTALNVMIFRFVYGIFL